MAKEPLAAMGHTIHVYDFHVAPGTGDTFIAEFDEADKSGTNQMHQSPAQVKDGVLCRDDDDPDHFYLLGEWNDKEAHQAIWNRVFGGDDLPERYRFVVGGSFKPVYATVVA
jgi:hypothetical protein